VDRREFLKRTGIAAGAVGTFLVGTALGSRHTAAVRTLPGDEIDGSTASPGRGLHVRKGEVFEFDPHRSQTLVVSGNVQVEGTLRMRPADPGVIHTIRFVGIDETREVGGGGVPLPTDVGVWVVDDGVLDIAGSAKLAWCRADGSLAKGQTSVDLDADPTGWHRGDELVITPTDRPGTPGHLGYDTVIVQRVSGRTVTFSPPLAFDHPECDTGRGVFASEVLNLTRNVRVEGTPSGRPHVFMLTTHPQHLSYAAMRYVGPRHGDNGEFVLGRYGVHFHMMGDNSRGSTVEGLVVRDAGNHSFVPHMSNGVTFRDCIAHDTVETQFWWDEKTPSDGTLWDHCVASKVNLSNEGGFLLGHGVDNTIRRCVGVGAGFGQQGAEKIAAFRWPAGTIGGLWTSEDCVGHNNASLGIYVWQNDSEHHDVRRFVLYRNGKFGAIHGAYNNAYLWQDTVFTGNGQAAMELWAVSKGLPTQLRFEGCLFDASGQPFAVQTNKHFQDPLGPTLFRNCQFRGSTTANLGLVQDHTAADWIELLDCHFDGNEFWLAQGLNPHSSVRVTDATHGDLTLRPPSQPGTYRAAWDAAVT